MLSQLHDIYQTNPAFKKKNLSWHCMFQHSQPMRNHHKEQLQEGNGKIYSEKVSGQSSSIQHVSPYIISPCIVYTLKYFFVLNFLTFKIEFKIVWPYIIILELVCRHLNLCFKKFDMSVTPSPFLNYMSAFCKLFIQLFFIDISRSLPRETIR